MARRIPLTALLTAPLVILAATLPRAGDDTAQHLLLTLSGAGLGDRFGAAIASGDLDGDGRAELVVGAPEEGASAGSARAYGTADGASLPAVQVGAPGERLGFAVAVVGDIDGDGCEDLALGAPTGAAAPGAPHSGRVEVRSGRDGALLLSSAPGSAGDRFGHALAPAGDIDGDGVPDLVAGAPHADDAGANAGRARVLSGADGSVLRNFDGAAFDLLGLSVAGAGDLDQDGFPDVLIGVPFADAAGFNAGAARAHSGADGKLLVAIDGTAVGDQLGTRVAAAGDVDGDGMPDLAAGAPGADGTDGAGFDAGRVVVASGAGGATLLEVSGEAPGAMLFAVAGVGDVDGDGHGDLLVAAPSAGSGEAGRVCLVRGADGATLLTFEGDGPHDWLGVALSPAGDADGDGVPDLALGAPRHDDDLDAPGYARVLSGASLALSADAHALSVAVGGTQGFSIVAGAEHAGRAYLLLGSLAGTAPGVQAGGVALPLAVEPSYFQHTLENPNAPPLAGSFATLDPVGTASAAFALPAAAPPGLAGQTVHHAYVVFDSLGMPVLASNAVPLALVP